MAERLDAPVGGFAASMSDAERSSSEELQRSWKQLDAHPARDGLAALAFDVLSRQAEGRALYCGADYVQAQAELHELARSDAETPLGNLLDALERGPEGALETAAISALATYGFGLRYQQADSAKQDELVVRFCRHADWLELMTSLGTYRWVDCVLSDEIAAAIWRHVGRMVAAQDAAEPAGQALAAMRLACLDRSSSAVAQHQLEEMAHARSDVFIKACSNSSWPAGSIEATSQMSSLEGVVRRVPTFGWLNALRILTGWALLQWIGRGLAWAVRYRRTISLRIEGTRLVAHQRASLLGRCVEERVEDYPLGAVRQVRLLSRFPALHMLVGTASLAAGVLLGGWVLLDGVRSGDTLLLMVGALIALLGATMDLVLSVWLPGRQGRVGLDVRVGRRWMHLSGLSLASAEAFFYRMQELERSQSAPSGGKGR